ncbi:serine palmitoyltransferase 2 [Roridomyces roridus]|uniref:serine C-palmitoyltransferase n=1 Tax=Roridomyces roridus TaxID=1738132 RepID=A0AAD7FN59_9AGAR|nr:serine palmitoyltransferase 2 [Roridomyces roridus]
MPSPMALPSPTRRNYSIFKKRSTSSLSSPQTAASYLSALSEADARRFRTQQAVPTETPAISLSSSVTSGSEDSVLHEKDAWSSLEVPLQPPTSEQVFTTVHSEFGHCTNQAYRKTSQYVPGTALNHVALEPSYYIVFTTYISYLILIVLGHVRDFFGKRFYPSSYQHLMEHDGYAPLNSDFDSFYTRRLKQRMNECFGQPVTGVAGRTIMLLDRYSTDYGLTQTFTGTRTRALNISSYNYLGFAAAKGGCADAVEESITRYGVTTGGSRLSGGSSDLHTQTEALVARFLGTEDALLSSMGFATNSAYIPALVGKGCLVISDELNHASIRFGVRLSGANVRMFPHNDMNALEALLREVISQGQPKTHRPWKKILIIVEGLYSMEGTIVDLPRLVELKQKYKFYLWVDEAHSIGALGPNGRGVVDYFGMDPAQIDILMGTFTKSFGAAGGYVAGSKALMDRLRVRGYLGAYSESMSPPVMMQIVSSMASIMGVAPPVLASSSPSTADVYTGPAPHALVPSWLTLDQNWVSSAYGTPDSPVAPLVMFNPGKMNMFHGLMKQYKTPIVTVVVAYPATSLVTSRVRFCVSASHTKDDIDTILRATDEIGDVLDLKHGLRKAERWTIDEVCERAVELVSA